MTMARIFCLTRASRNLAHRLNVGSNTLVNFQVSCIRVRRDNKLGTPDFVSSSDAGLITFESLFIPYALSQVRVLVNSTPVKHTCQAHGKSQKPSRKWVPDLSEPRSWCCSWCRTISGQIRPRQTTSYHIRPQYAAIHHV